MGTPPRGLAGFRLAHQPRYLAALLQRRRNCDTGLGSVTGQGRRGRLATAVMTAMIADLVEQQQERPARRAARRST